MRPPLRHRLLAAVTIALAAVGLIAGCAGEVNTSTDAGAAVEVRPEQAEPNAAPGAGDAQAPGPEVAERAVVTTTSVSLKSEDTAETVTRIEQLVATHQGYFESREEYGTDRPAANLTIRIPAKEHDAFISELKPLAEVDSISTVEQDVTLAQLDLDARISTLEGSVTALQSMLAKSTDTSTMLEIEQTLTDRQADLQSLTAQRDALKNDVAMSTVTVQISAPHVATPNTDDRAPGFLAGLEFGWNAFLDFLAFAATALGFLLPALVLLALILVPLVIVIRRRVRAHRRAKDAAPPAGARPAPVPAGMPPMPRPRDAAQPAPAEGGDARDDEPGGTDAS